MTLQPVVGARALDVIRYHHVIPTPSLTAWTRAQDGMTVGGGVGSEARSGARERKIGESVWIRYNGWRCW